MRVVIAPDKFKGTFAAREVAGAMAQGVRRVWPDAEIALIPMADGGDGTLAALVTAGWSEETGCDHTYVSQGSVVCVELASVCGLVKSREARMSPWQASTRELGELMRCAVQCGAKDLWVALGGSASTEGGVGMLQGLGFAVLDASGAEVPPGVPGLLAAHRIGEAPGWLEEVNISSLCDVLVPLLGPSGAAQFFGPRKGLSASEVAEAENAMLSWSELLAECFGVKVADIPGAGAAGGTAAALIALGAQVKSGAEAIAQAVELPAQLQHADLVITGEGSFDASSMVGKVTGLVAGHSLSPGARVLIVTGWSETGFQLEGIAHRVDHLSPERELSLVDIASLVQEFCEGMAAESG